MLELAIGGIAIFAVLEGIVKMIKSYDISPKLMPLINIVIAEAFMITLTFSTLIELELQTAVWTGLVMGLALGGFYDFRTKTLQLKG